MNASHATQQQAGRPRWSVACKRAALCAVIAGVLGGWQLPAHAFPAANGGASASSNGADANGGDADFDRSLLAGAGQNTTDLSRFEHGNPVTPGIYNADIFLNNTWMARDNVRFAITTPQANATPCVDRKLLDTLNLHPAKLSPATLAQLDDPKACVSLDSLIPHATLSFDMTQLRLDASVPQAYLGKMPRGYVSPEYWDEGIPAAMLNYNFNGYRTSSQGQTQTTSYLGLNAGLNLGPWHLREDATVNWQSASGTTPARRQWQNIDAYIQRDLPSIRALLTLGDSYTDGTVFDSYGLRGVQLATDDRMLPQSLQGYAPIIRGVANTNAKVTVRQNGVLIYETTVAPGPFTINDLYPTGYGGSLDVTVTEADGHVSTFTVPYASVAQLLRPGITRFDLAVGQLRDTSIHDKPAVVQATIQRGINNLLTAYAGIAASQSYAEALIGSAVNTRYGAFALDVTESHAHIPGYAAQSGQSVRLSYSKIIPSTQTTLSVAAYRYSTGGYLDLADAAEARDYARRGINAFNYVPPTITSTIDGVPSQSILTPAQQAALSGTTLGGNPIAATGLQLRRNNFTMSLNQRLGESGGSIYANVTASDYWNRNGTDTQFQVGYNNTFHRVNYGISATRAVDVLGHYDNQYFINISIPLGSGPHAPNFTLNVSHDQSTGSQDQAMINGTLGSESQFSYGATATHSSSGGGNAGSVNGAYRSPYAVFDASYGNGNGYSQTSLGVSGAIVAHAGGVTFGQPTGDTVGIVYVPGAAGAHINSSAGATVDRGGYALIPYLNPYNLNVVQIDPKGLPLDVQLDATSARVAPYAGAIVLMKFKTESGRTIVVRAHSEDGNALPFGAEVDDEKGRTLGIVGQAGQVLLRGVKLQGLLDVHWTDDQGTAQSCSFPYKLAPSKGEKRSKRYEEINVTCAKPRTVAQVAGNGL